MVQSCIAVLLATCNGEKFLQAQLESLARQTVPNVDLWVSDDGSTDRTHAILAEGKQRWPHLVRSGAYRQGHVDNIGLYLACLFKKL